MGSLRRRGWQIQSPSSARGFTPLGEVESDGSGLMIAARSQLTHALVDIRVLTPALKGDRARMRQLSGDKDTLREVRHTNLVSVMEVDDRAGAIVYESVRGGTLAQMLIGQGPLELSAGLVLLEDCIAGLEALHNVGVIHRNVTPESVVVETTGAVLLRDAELSPSVSPGGLLSEQSQFIAPEVLAGAAHTRASDLYAATAVFLDAIGGRASKPGMRTDLRPLLGEGMSRDPSARSATLTDFRRELDDYARAVVGETWRKEGRALLTAASAAQASRAIRVGSPSEPPSSGVDEALAAVALLRSPGPRDPRIWAGLGTLGFAALIALIFVVRGFGSGGNASASLLQIPSNGFPNLLGGAIPSAPPNAASSPGVGPQPTSGTNIFAPTTVPTGPTANPTGSPTGNPGSNPTPNPAGPPPIAQTIAFTSSVPSGLTYGGSYTVTANGGRSGMPVVFSSLSPSVCAHVTSNGFRMTGVGTCTIVANQAGNAQYSRASQQIMPSFSVGQASQRVAFTTNPVSPTYNGAPYVVRATAPGGAVTFSANPASVACNVTPTGSVTFTAAGTCIIVADQAGNADYTPAPPWQQQFDVARASQTITITSSSPCNPCATQTPYTVSGTSSSGLQVTFGIDSSSTPGSCSISGNTITINGGTGFPGNCVIDWFQVGDQNYAPAATRSQTITVS
jgi:serine/threonine protein kinase